MCAIKYEQNLSYSFCYLSSWLRVILTRRPSRWHCHAGNLPSVWQLLKRCKHKRTCARKHDTCMSTEEQAKHYQYLSRVTAIRCRCRSVQLDHTEACSASQRHVHVMTSSDGQPQGYVNPRAFSSWCLAHLGHVLPSALHLNMLFECPCLLT